MEASTIVFRRPTGLAFYNVGMSEPEAQAFGVSVAKDSPDIWGEYVFARKSVFQGFGLEVRYHFKFVAGGLTLKHRLAEDETFLPLHYLTTGGRQLGTLVFPLHWKDKATGANCHLNVACHQARSGKFTDMFHADHEARFVIEKGKPFLVIGNALRDEFKVPLEVVG